MGCLGMTWTNGWLRLALTDAAAVVVVAVVAEMPGPEQRAPQSNVLLPRWA